MRVREFVLIVEGYREAEQEFAKTNDVDQVKKMIDAYRSLVDRNQVQGQERNIDHWRRQGWDTFSQFVQSKSQERSKTQVKRVRGIEKNQITLQDNDDWLIVIPLDKDTSCFHGRGTNWCTTKASQNYFGSYFYNMNVTLIYCINSQTGGKWAIAARHKMHGRAEYFDQQDRKLTAQAFDQQTGLDSAQIIQQALSQQNIAVADAARKPYRDAIARLNQLDYLSDEPRSPEEKAEIERLLLFVKDFRMIINYARLAIQGRWPEIEHMIVRDPVWATSYVRFVTLERWHEAEPAIAKDPRSAYYYARDVIQDRWREAEPVIAKDPQWAYNYAEEVIKGPWPEAGINES